jgi:hypothetical protein
MVIGSAMGLATEEKALAASPLPLPQTRRERELESELQMLKAQLEATARVRIRQDMMAVGSAMGVASDEKDKEVKFKDWVAALANTDAERYRKIMAGEQGVPTIDGRVCIYAGKSLSLSRARALSLSPIPLSLTHTHSLSDSLFLSLNRQAVKYPRGMCCR